MAEQLVRSVPIIPHTPAELERQPLILNQRPFGWLSDHIAGVAEGKTPRWWWMMFVPSFTLMVVCFSCITYLLTTGVGVWGLMVPVAWAWDITNFVFWIGIGHAGTLISAILFLLRQRWRTSINRAAEAMTIFAVICAGIFPLIHIGRIWLGWWLLPLPNANSIWPQFRSPLLWDVFAVSTYLTVSLLFWYVGLVPDLATLRDRAKSLPIRRLFGALSLGWRGAARHWERYEEAYLLLAGLSTPLVLSVHTVVSFDFTIGIIPGWHSTIFPPYFVAGAIYAGFAMVLTLAIPLRVLYHLEDFLTMRHLENMGKVMLVTGLIVGYGYVFEAFFAWYSSNTYEQYMVYNRMFGPYWAFYWSLILCNIVMPQFLWKKSIRTSPAMLFFISMFVNVGMWLERFEIVVTSLHRDFLPSSWGWYWPTRWDIMTFFGTIGLFIMLFFLFIRVLPMISIFEMRTIVPAAKVKGAKAH